MVTELKITKAACVSANSFYGLESVTKLTLGDSEQYIDVSAFADCSALESATLGRGVKSIESSAFSGCGQLSSINIPDNATRIGDYAFDGCYQLANIIFDGTMAEWQAIEKGTIYNNSTYKFSVICSDGTLDRDGNQKS